MLFLGFFPARENVFTKAQMKRRHSHCATHSPTAIWPWLGGELAVWFSQTILLIHFLQTFDDEVLEVSFDNEVNNCVNVIHCKLVRKQVHTDEWQTAVSLQAVGFFGTVQRTNPVPVMSTIYFNSVVPIWSVAKLCCRGKNGPLLQRDIYIRLHNFSSLFLLVAFPARLCLSVKPWR